MLTFKVQAQSLPASERYVANEVLVKLAPGIEAAGEEKVVLDLLSAHKLNTIYGTEVQVWQIPDMLTINGRTINNPEELGEYLKNSPHPYIEYAEPNYIYSISLTPNDPMLGSLWGMNKIQAPQAWDTETDCSDVVVGVIDTGIDWTHPDLVNNIWQNLGEDADGDGHVLEYIGGVWQFDPGDIDGIDNDGNGYADDFIGWDFKNNDNNPMDDNSHGTHCAGTIGAQGNNGLGVVGVCWQVKLMGLKFFGASGQGGYTSDAVAALNYATNKGVKITNNSWGGGGYSQTLYNAILNAQNNNAVFVAAAGNSSSNNDNFPHYPSNYTLPNIISVAASTPGDILAGFSCYGATSVDLAAPGSGILSTVPGGAYGNKSGTSMAAPHVTGAAALVYCPGMGYADVKAAILNQVDVVPALAGKCVTSGRLNVFKALNNANCCNALSNFTLPAGNCVNQLLTFINTSTGATSYQWKINNVLQSTGTQFIHTFASAGTYSITLIASNSNCSHTSTKNITIVTAPASGFTYTLNGYNIAVVANTTNALNYLWLYGDDNTGSGQGSTHTYNSAGTFNVCLTVSNSCGNNSSCQSISISNNPCGGTEDVWTSYFGGIQIGSIVEEGNFLWFGMIYTGLVRMNKFTFEKTYFNTFNSELPSNHVSTISIDAVGNKWIGTDSGLTKFDGTNWITYNTSNSGIPNNNINSIAIDIIGNKWIGTENGFVRFDGSNWIVFNTSNSILPTNDIRTIAIDASGNMWICTYGGLAKFDGINWTVYNTSNSGLPNNYIHSIAIDAVGNKWILSSWGGLTKFDGNNWTNYNSTNSGLPNSYLTSIAIDISGNVWIGSHGNPLESILGSLIKFDGTNWTTYNNSNSGYPGNDVSVLAIDADGNKMIVGSFSSDLILFDDTNWTAHSLGISLGSIDIITIDPSGNKWFSGSTVAGLLTTYSGLGKFDGTNWAHYDISPSNAIRAISFDDVGNIWIGTYETFWIYPYETGGLTKFDGVTMTNYNSSNSGLPEDAVHAIAIDADGNKWIGSYGLTKFDGTNWTNYNSNNSGLPDNWVLTIAIDENGNKWIGSSQGLTKFDGTNWTTYNTSNSGLSNNWVSTITIDEIGNKWIGSSEGLTKFDGANWTTYNTSNSGLPHNGVSEIAIDAEGNKWIATIGGLSKFDGVNWTTYNVSNSGLPSDTLLSIAIGANGDKWIGTNIGITVLSNCLTPCPSSPSFTTPQTTCANDITIFTNTSANSTGYKWYVNGVNVSNSTHLSYTFTVAGSYIIKLEAYNGTCFNEYTQTVTVSSDCVWPGDANADGVVNMMDWLVLGLAYNKTGTPRSDQTIGFSPKPAANFTTSFTGELFTGINHKHADCNGSGIVNAADTTAIVQNFGQSSGAGPASTDDFDDFPEALISSEANTPVVALNNSAFIDITLQNTVNGGAINCYGLAFTLQYDGVNPRLHFGGSCFGTPGVDFIASYKVNTVSKLLYVGITSINHTNVSAIGKVATLEVTVDELPAGDPPLYSMPVTGASVTDNNGYLIPMGAGATASMQVFEYLAQEQAPLLNAKVLLQGAIPGDIFIGAPQMNTTLRSSNLLPVQQPYHVLPWFYPGTESAGSPANLPSNAVDWVLLELRHAVTTAIVWQKAAILLNDGSIQDAAYPIPGRVRLESTLSGDLVPANQSYYLIVRHRNHLAVASSTPLTISGNLMTFNFTLQPDAVLGSNQLTPLGGQYAMKAGDVFADGVIHFGDYNAYATNPNMSNQYHRNDCNLDGNVNATDFQTLAPNISSIGVNMVRYNIEL